MFVDVHTHLTHEDFSEDYQDIIRRAEEQGFGAIVVNGLSPKSNREILAMAEAFPLVKPALGIYPLEAINHLLPEDSTLSRERFSVQDEIRFIEDQAKAKAIIAIGECGLDGHWLQEECLIEEQEKVLDQLVDIAVRYDLPLIVHTRKLEERTMALIANHKAKKVDFHCFGGKVALAQKGAETHHWYFSIPANAHRSQNFQKMLKVLPEDCLLTETDAPYLAPERNTRNVPLNVIGTVKLFAQLRQWDFEKAKEQIWLNYTALFN